MYLLCLNLFNTKTAMESTFNSSRHILLQKQATRQLNVCFLINYNQEECLEQKTTSHDLIKNNWYRTNSDKSDP